MSDMLGNTRKWNTDQCHNMNAKGIGIKKQVALLWSADPYGAYGDSHDLVGSVLAHMAHLERHGAVYWTMKSKADLEKYPDTICCLILNSIEIEDPVFIFFQYMNRIAAVSLARTSDAQG